MLEGSWLSIMVPLVFACTEGWLSLSFRVTQAAERCAPARRKTTATNKTTATAVDPLAMGAEDPLATAVGLLAIVVEVHLVTVVDLLATAEGLLAMGNHSSTANNSSSRRSARCPARS